MARAVRAWVFAGVTGLFAGCQHPAPVVREPSPIPAVPPSEHFMSVEIQVYSGPLPFLSTTVPANGSPLLLDEADFERLARSLAADTSLDLVSAPRILTELGQSAALTCSRPQTRDADLALCVRGNVTDGDSIALDLSVNGWSESHLELVRGHGVALIVAPESGAPVHGSLLVLVRPTLESRP